MTCFEIILNTATALGTVGAVIVGMWAINNATSNTTKQIKTEKIEEIYEITTSLHYYYGSLFFLYSNLKDSHDFDNFDASARKVSKDNYQMYLKQIKENVDIEKLSDKTARLKILANAYLDGELRLKVLTYNDLFEKLITVAIQGQMIIQGMFYQEGFPEILNLYKYLEDDLLPEFVKLISMSNGSIKSEDIQKYREANFKSSVGLK